MNDAQLKRFMSHVRSDGECWIWTASTSTNGYGQVSIGGRTQAAHRASYEHFVGPIPEGLTIDHVRQRGCKSKTCVNPAHLEAVTLLENIRRGETSAAAVNARKTKCIAGHAFTPENTRVRAGGRRDCRTCERRRNRESDKRIRDRVKPIVLYAAAAMAALAMAQSAAAGGAKWNTMTTAEQTAFVKQAVRHDRTALRWWGNHRHRPPARSIWKRDTLKRITTPRPRWPVCDSVDARLPAAVCRAATRLPTYEAALDRLLATFPETGDWLTAVSVVQRAYPGSYDWIERCSGSEGGHGVFVYYGGRAASSYEISAQVESSTPGGWMQYFPGTFWGDFNAAAADLTARGFRLPASASSWFSPLGQAAAAGWAYVYGSHSTGKWTGSGCWS